MNTENRTADWWQGYEKACKSAADAQGITPIVNAMRERGLDAIAEQTGGFVMNARVYFQGLHNTTQKGGKPYSEKTAFLAISTTDEGAPFCGVICPDEDYFTEKYGFDFGYSVLTISEDAPDIMAKKAADFVSRFDQWRMSRKAVSHSETYENENPENTVFRFSDGAEYCRRNDGQYSLVVENFSTTVETEEEVVAVLFFLYSGKNILEDMRAG